jgi:sRNA-binding regulator protein Hfq
MPQKKVLSKHDQEQYSYDPKAFYTSNEPDWQFYTEAKAKNTPLKFTLQFGDVIIGRLSVWGRYSVIVETEDDGRILIHKDAIVTAREAKI